MWSRNLTIWRPAVLLLVLCLSASPATAAWTLLSHTSAGSTAGATITTGTIDTTGADLLVVAISEYEGGSPPSVLSDSNSNSWTGLTAKANGANATRCRLYYVQGGMVGGGHTFTSAASGTATYSSLAVLAFSGSTSTPFNVENGALSGSGTSLSAGSITPGQDVSLVVSALAHDGGAASVAVTASLAIVETVTYSGGNHDGLSIAWLSQSPAAAINPNWTWTGTVASTAVIAAFKPVAGGGVSPVGMLLRGVAQ